MPNTKEAFWLDQLYDRTASGGKYRLGIFKHSTGVVGTVPNEDGSVPSGLTELSGNGYSSPAINNASSEFSAAVPGDPTTKSGPSSGSWSFGTFTGAPQSGSEKETCMAVIDRITRTSISCTTVNGSATVTVGGGATVSNTDLGRAVGRTTVDGSPGGSIAIPDRAVIGKIIDSTHFEMWRDGAAVTAANGTNGTAGTASITLGEIIIDAFPYFDATAVLGSPPTITTVNGSNVITFASAVSSPTIWEGATITVPGNTQIPSGTKILFMADDGKSAVISKDAIASASGITPTITGSQIAKTYATNDNPVIDTTNPLVVQVGKPKDPF